jgi:hypothetical protein
MIAYPQPSCHNRLKSLNSFSVGLLDRYGAILGLITDPQPIAALEQPIRETRYPVACKFGRGRKRYYRSDRDGAAAVVHLRGRNKLAR